MDEVSTNFANISVPTRNGFCREQNMNTATFILNAAEIREGQDVAAADTWKITEVPCSAAMETWSIAAGLVIQQTGKFHINGYDLNPKVLQSATQPYEMTKAELGLAFLNWGLPRECVDLFDAIDSKHIQPRRELREKVTFAPLDASTQIPPKADVVITNNLFGNLYPDASDQVGPIVRNLAASLEDNGVFTANDAWHRDETLAEIKRAGLRPVRSKNLRPTDSRYPELFQKQPPHRLLSFLHGRRGTQ